MPTYTVNMQGSPASDAWAEGASALAKALTPDYKAEAEAQALAARADASYASAANSLASRDKTFAETKGINWEQAVRENLWNQFQNGDLTREDMIQLSAEAGIAIDPAGSLGDLGSVNQVLASNQPGMTAEGMTLPQMGAGMEYGNTFTGFKDTQSNDNFRWLEEQAADAAADTVEVINPTSGAPMIVPRSQAVQQGLQPVLSETEAKGTSLLTGNALPGQGAGSGGNQWQFDGTGMDQQSINFTTHYNLKRLGGQEITPGEELQYRQVFHREFMQPKEKWVDNGNGTQSLIQYTPEPPPGIWNPFTNSMTGQPGPAAATETDAPLTEATPDEVAPTATAAPVPAAGGTEGVGVPTDNPAAVKTVATVGNAKAKYTEGQQKLVQLGGQIATNVNLMNALTGYDPASDTFTKNNGAGLWPTVANTAMADMTEGIADSFLPESIGDMGRNMVLSDENRQFEDLRFGFIEPMLRLASGAATPEEEVRRYQQYAPQPGLPDHVNQARLRRLNMMAAAVANVAQAQGLSSQALMAMADTQQNLEEINAAVQAELAAMGVNMEVAPEDEAGGGAGTGTEVPPDMDLSRY